MKASDGAKRTGVTVRTLHYYDEIGLLSPSEVASNGYRVYNDADLEVLQQILFFRELDFSLEDIRAIMQNPAYKKETALQNQKALLVQKRDRLDRLITLVDKTLKGERDVSFKQFDTTKIDEAKQQYAAEAKQRWGHTAAYAEYEKKSVGYHTVQQLLPAGELEKNIACDLNDTSWFAKIDVSDGAVFLLPVYFTIFSESRSEH